MKLRLPKLLRFASRVLSDFFLRNHGLLLTSAVAYNVMLSLIPLSAVLIVVVSHFIDPTRLLETITAEVSLIAPGFVPILREVLLGFLSTRNLIGWLGGLSLLIFSSLAFRVIEDSFAIIFHRPLPALKRKFWVSALMPYLFITIIGVGLLALTAVNAVIDAQLQKHSSIPSINGLLNNHLGGLIYTSGVIGLVILFTLFYKIMPVAKISLGRAFAGGLTATILWEIVRHLLVAHYEKISVVNLVYGSMATLIVVFVTLEAIALILLLGAQVIANLQASANAGNPWHEQPETAPEPSHRN
jgi:membrane protein